MSAGEQPPALQQSGTFGTGSFGKRTLVNRYELHKKLGSGNFGAAYLVKDLKVSPGSKDEWKVAKQMSVGDIAPDETVDAMKEGRLLSKLNHPAIVKFYDSFFDNDLFCIVTEYCDGGDLKSKIADSKKKSTAFDESVVLDWFVQLMLAVEYIHNRRILHRDLTTGNVFLKNDMVKLGDFGISRVLMGTCDMASTFTGTPYYMSPEVLKHDGYNSKSDIWSVGCIVYELCTLNHAFEGQGLMGVMYKIVEGEIPKLPNHYSPELNDIYLKILTRDIHKRPSATEILQTAFMSAQIERLKAKLETGGVAAKASSEQLEKEARDISELINEPAHLEDLRRTMGYTSDDPAPSEETVQASTENDATVVTRKPSSGTIKSSPTRTIKNEVAAEVTLKSSPTRTIKTESSEVTGKSPVVVAEKPNDDTPQNNRAISDNQKPRSAGKPKVPPPGKTTAPAVAAKGPVARIKTAGGTKPAPTFKREPTQISSKSVPEPNPEEVAAAEAEFMRSLQRQRESGGFKATYETSDQLERRRQNTVNDADTLLTADEEEEYREAYETQQMGQTSNLSPKQLMYIRKKSEADKKAQELNQVTHETYLVQKAKKDDIRQSYQVGSSARRSIALPPEDSQQLAASSNFGDNGAPVDRTKASNANNIDQRRRFLGDGDLVSRSVVARRDDRPITPMKKDIYRDGSKELDFQNGIPTNPQIAEFYYSYYDEFDDAEESGVHHQHEAPMVSQSYREVSRQGVKGGRSPNFMGQNKNQRIKFVSQENSFESAMQGDDRAQLANYMATILTRPSMPTRSSTFIDESTSHTFGPQARQSKIQVMRNNCERKLGPVKFRQVYDYLKDARSDHSGDANEQQISNDLRRMIGNPNDAFLVDQLLFLETTHSG